MRTSLMFVTVGLPGVADSLDGLLPILEQKFPGDFITFKATGSNTWKILRSGQDTDFFAFCRKVEHWEEEMVSPAR